MNRQPPNPDEFDVQCVVDDRLFYRLQIVTLAGVAGLVAGCVTLMVWIIRRLT
jgi:hypothetical protein